MRKLAGFELRPRDLGELLDLSFRVYRANLGLFVLFGIPLSVVLATAGLAWQAAFFAPAFAADPQNPDVALLGAMFATMPLLIGAYAAVYGAGLMAVNAIVEETLLGRPVSADEVVRLALPRVPWAMLTMLLKTAVWMVGLAFCVLPGIFALIVLVLAVPAVYLERRRPFSAFARSWELVLRRGPGGLGAETNWVRVVIIGFVTLIVIYVLNFLSGVPLLVAQAVGAARNVTPVATALGPQVVPLSLLVPLQLLGAVIQGAFLPLFMIPWPLLHYDIRMRHEGLDLELRVERLRPRAADAPA